MAEPLYRQCFFERPAEGGGTHRTTGWVPERHRGHTLKVGLQVTLDDKPEWWTVVEVGTKTISRKDVQMQELRWRKHRQATDI